MRTRIRTKIGESNFGEFMIIRQIRQGFPPPMFPSIRYLLAAVIASTEIICEIVYVL